MIKYHGTPITPKEVFYLAMKGRNSLVSFAEQRDLKKSLEVCEKIILDNGAFTTWNNIKKGKIADIDWNKHWGSYYDWVREHINNIENYFIPDVIDGSEEENDELIVKFFKKFRQNIGVNPMNSKAIPIWHVNESIDRLIRLSEAFNYIAFGSAGEYGTLGTKKWHKKMNLAMKAICNKDGVPKVKIHMLRCLDPKIFLHYPFYSGDSTNLAQNHSIHNTVKGDKKLKIKPSNDGWKIVIRNIEKYNSPEKYIFKKHYEARSLF